MSQELSLTQSDQSVR